MFVEKIPGEKNAADLMTKFVNLNEIEERLSRKKRKSFSLKLSRSLQEANLPMSRMRLPSLPTLLDPNYPGIKSIRICLGLQSPLVLAKM